MRYSNGIASHLRGRRQEQRTDRRALRRGATGRPLRGDVPERSRTAGVGMTPAISECVGDGCPGRQCPGVKRRDRATRTCGAPEGGERLAARRWGAQRRRLLALRSAGEIGDDAFHRVEEEVDLLELTADPRPRPAGGAA